MVEKWKETEREQEASYQQLKEKAHFSLYKVTSKSFFKERRGKMGLEGGGFWEDHASYRLIYKEIRKLNRPQTQSAGGKNKSYLEKGCRGSYENCLPPRHETTTSKLPRRINRCDDAKKGKNQT